MSVESTAGQSVSGSGQRGPVFADVSGRRWRRARVVLTVLAVLLVAAAAVLLPAAYRPPHAGSDAAMLSIRDTGAHAPVIGTGPLTRVLRVDRDGSGAAVGVEPFTGERVRVLDPVTSYRIGDANYVIEHFGYSATAAKTLAFTFDDGPDPQVTPELLDLLSREKVPATFFLVGRFISQHPDLVRRMVAEGHAIGIHTVTHPDVATMPDWRVQAELVGTDRLLRSVAGVSATFWRMPYADPTVANEQATIDGLLRGQRLGYQHTSYDFDTQDWKANARPEGSAADIARPTLTGSANITLLAHDAGGPNRQRTVAYVADLIQTARAHGYTFHTMPQVNPAIQNGNPVASPQLGDQVVWVASQVFFAWPDLVMLALFVIAVVVVVVTGLGSCLIGIVRHRRRARMQWPSALDRFVPTTVAMAAYNEERVIARTLRTILDSDYPVSEVLVVDDGSSDGTADQVRAVMIEDRRVRLIQQVNSGKATALNRAVREATGEVVVTLDADTIMTPSTVGNLVRHFAADETGRLGAVAGVVRVGNRSANLLTRWQALEYLTQIAVERGAQDSLGAISIIPGACAAWRREAIVQAGGYSTDTLAEDCDLALTLHELGWQVTQDDEALAYTEAPETVDDLLKQRTRWTFGTMQSVAKHRGMMLRRKHRWLGWYVLPNYLISFVLPLVSMPFVTTMAVITAQQEGVAVLAKFFALFMLAHLVVASVAVRLLDEDWRHLAIVPIYRLVYEPMRAYLLFTCTLNAIKGVRVGWNKLDRTGSLDEPKPVLPTASGSTRTTRRPRTHANTRTRA